MQRKVFNHNRSLSFLAALIATVLCVAPLSAQGQCGGELDLDYTSTDSSQFFESYDKFTLVGYNAEGQEFGRTERQLVGNDLLISYEGDGTYVKAACSLETWNCVISENGQVLQGGILGVKASQVVSRLETQSAGLMRPGLPIGLGGIGIGLEVECDVCWGTLTFTNEEGESVTIPVPYACNCRVKIKVDLSFP